MKLGELKPGDRFFYVIDGHRCPARAPLFYRKLVDEKFVECDQGPTTEGTTPDKWVISVEREIIAA